MNKVKRFEDLVIWKDARLLANEVYSLFSHLKDYGFKDQIQRASVSVINNIAEGFERNTNKEFIRFLYMAKASCGEVRSMSYIAGDLHYLNESETLALQENCKKISIGIYNLIRYLSDS